MNNNMRVYMSMTYSNLFYDIHNCGCGKSPCQPNKFFTCIMFH